MPVAETIMTVSAVLSALQGLRGLLGGDPYEKEAKRAGSTAASLERQITSSLTRRLAGAPSATARELARQAQEGITRQTAQARESLAREAQRAGTYGAGPSLAQQRLASERGIRSATAAARGVELADLRGAEAQAAEMAQRLRIQEQVLRSQRIAEQQVYGNLLAAGAQIGTYLYTMRELRGTMQTTPTAPAAPAAGPMSFPPSGIFGPAPTMPAGRMALPGGTLGQWPTYQFSAMAGAAPSATAPPTTPRMALTLPPASTPFGTLGPPGLDLARMLAALQPPRPPLAAEENPALARFLEYLHPGAY